MERGCAFRQRLSHNGAPSIPVPETSSPGGPLGAEEPICPAVPSPLPAGVGGGSAPPPPRLLPRRGGRRWHRLLRRGTKVPTAACGRKCPALGKEGRRVQYGGGGAPSLACQPRAAASTPPPAPPPQGCAAPRPWPLARPSRPPALGPEVRGRPPLVVCLEGKGGRRGEKPKVGLAEGLTGNSTTLA